MAKYHSGSFQPAEGAQPGKIRAAHLLVKHAESRRPSSWREVRAHIGSTFITADGTMLELEIGS